LVMWASGDRIFVEFIDLRIDWNKIDSMRLAHGAGQVHGD